MPEGPVLLSDAIEEFMAYRKSAGYKANTLLVNRRALSKLLALLGNVQVRHLEARHGEQFQAYLGGLGYKPNSINAYLASVSIFIKWCRSRRYLGPGSDPFSNVRYARSMVEPRQRLTKEQFSEVLDCCVTPHDRIVCALGLYLFLRAGEVAALKVGDLDLDRGEILVHVEKSNMIDYMPICEELDAELRRWLTWYSADIEAPLKDEMYLIPRRRRPAMANDGSGPGGGFPVYREHHNCQPTLKSGRLHRNAQRALRAYGWELRDPDGRSKMEGVHTLRRSGARALFDELVERGNYDGVLRHVAAMLHHKSTVTTERYLGLDVDVKKRNDLLRGRRMFHTQEDAVAESDNVYRIS